MFALCRAFVRPGAPFAHFPAFRPPVAVPTGLRTFTTSCIGLAAPSPLLLKRSLTTLTLKPGQYKKNKYRSRRPALFGAPYRKATVIKLLQVTPRKPNSAKRKMALVEVRSPIDPRFPKAPRRVKRVLASLRGGNKQHQLRDHSQVIIQGGGGRDVPSCNYSLVRGRLDFAGMIRRSRPSKYGTKKNMRRIYDGK
eukprot:TRINITY_DN28062_c0_g2_i1.p1 TRINITY_DN28062_c0_g2~~TRINITY_DN28062_c0_g2_i1.p1  ORF type:complete len:202 (+),score=19.54 TRINITY_DN28062_c0_g2_i1:23-607(+)